VDAWTSSLVSGLIRIRHKLSLANESGFIWAPTALTTFERVGHGIAADDGEAALGESLFAEQPRYSPPGAQSAASGGAVSFYGRHDAGGDDIAVHDAAEDVDENPFHVGSCKMILKQR
jgi:hypothetical protein